MTKKKLRQEIQKITKQLIEKYKPQKIILFGSSARGSENPHDADLLIVKEEVPSLGIERIREVSSLFKHAIGVDALVFRPCEIEKRIYLGDPFIKQVLKEGRVLYGS